MSDRQTLRPGGVDGGGMKSAYLRVVVVWLGVLGALWWLQQAFL